MPFTDVTFGHVIRCSGNMFTLSNYYIQASRLTPLQNDGAAWPSKALANITKCRGCIPSKWQLHTTKNAWASAPPKALTKTTNFHLLADDYD